MSTENEGVITEITHSPTLGAMAKALAKAQSQMGGAKKTAQNPHLKNRYAQLEDVIEAVAPLSENGIAYSQLPFTAGKDFVGVITLFVHESGEFIASKATMPVAKADAQGHGSGYTYLRRYALMGMAGIAPTDDDGEAATRPPVRKAPEPTKVVSAFADPAMTEVMETYASEVDGAADVKALMAVYTRVVTDVRLAQDARDFITQRCTSRRKQIEGRAA